MCVSDLISLLGSLTSEDFPGTVYSLDDCTSLYRDVVGLANDLLVNSDGRPNWAAHKQLGAAGYRVFPGEQDSFGWLTGGIYVPEAGGTVWYG